MYNVNVLFNADIVVNVIFGEATYSFDENTNKMQRRSVGIDVILSNPSSNTITITIQSKDINATGMIITVWYIQLSYL